LPAFTGWGYSKDLPRFARKTFRDRWDALQDEEPGAKLQTYAGAPVGERNDRRDMAPPDQRTLVSQFMEELTKVNGMVRQTNSDNLTHEIIDLLASRQIYEIHLEPGVLDEAALRKAGIAIRRTPDAAIRAGVTGAICGLADTGSILIADGEGDPLKASLLPEIHIAVLCASNILPTLADAFRLPLLTRSRSAVIITGPSRTADIEMSLTIGMHGPRELHIFLVDSPK
jgi:L-lactate utilization protein LutC